MNRGLIKRPLEGGSCLRCEGENISSQEAIELARYLQTDTVVTSIKLARNSIGHKGAEAFAKTICCNETIKYADLSSNRIGSEGATALAGALRQNRALEVLKIGGNFIGDSGITEISSGLLENQSLRELDLQNNGISGVGLEALSRAIRGREAGFDTLELGWNKINEDGMAGLVDAISCNSVLTQLGLSMCELSAECIRLLAEGLRKNKSIECLDLSGNNIKAEEAVVLVDALVNHPRIRSINLKSNAFGEVGLNAVATLIEKKKNVSANLCFNCMNIESAKTIATSIRKNPSCTRPILRYLSAVRRSLSDDSFKMNRLRLFSYLTGVYVDLNKPDIQTVLLGAVYGAGIQQLLKDFHKEELYLLPQAMWRVGSKLQLDGFYELLRSKPELFRDA